MTKPGLEVVLAVESSAAVCEYVKVEASMTLVTLKVPSKIVPFFPCGSPLIKTVPGLPGFRLCGVEVVTVTTLDVLVAVDMPMRACVATFCKSTTERVPPPPGVT